MAVIFFSTLSILPPSYLLAQSSEWLEPKSLLELHPLQNQRFGLGNVPRPSELCTNGAGPQGRVFRSIALPSRWVLDPLHDTGLSNTPACSLW